MSMLRIGTAGWTVPKQHLRLFPESASEEKLSHLQRCAGGLNCVEVNSSFHRPHRRKTWERWATSTPDAFRFAVKLPKTVTHGAKLINTGALLAAFFEQVQGLGEKLGPVLVQLPPRLAFEEGAAHEFFTVLREVHTGLAVLEPRHESWFTASVDRLLRSYEIGRVAADPPKGSASAASPGGWQGVRYWRLHGSPRTYYSEYSEHFLNDFAEQLVAGKKPVSSESWVIFDNTALGHATANALRLAELADEDARSPNSFASGLNY